MDNNPKGYTRADYIAAYDRLGSKRAVARELGVTKSTVQGALKDYAPNQGIAAALERVGVEPENARFGYRRVQGEDGSFDTVFWRMPAQEQESLAERIRAALDGLKAAPRVAAPRRADSDLMTLYPIADLHLGLMAWGRETGEDYDTATAAKRLREWVGRCVASSPNSHTGVILSVGDFYHADDQTNQTPASRHQLDVDTRHYKTLDAGIAALDACVMMALDKHKKVIVRILAGNHDPHSSMALTFAMAERFRDNPRVEVVKEPSPFWSMEWGKCMLAATHGEKAKPDRIVHFMADEFAEVWGRTRHRFLFTAHFHSLKAQDIGGVQHEQLRAMTARDAYAYSSAYSARAQLQAITYHKDDGEVQRVKVAA